MVSQDLLVSLRWLHSCAGSPLLLETVTQQVRVNSTSLAMPSLKDGASALAAPVSHRLALCPVSTLKQLLGN